MKENLDLITIRTLNTKKAIDILDQYGCCVINNYLNKKELSNLKFEFDHMFLEAKKNNTIVINKHPTNKMGSYIICKKN